MNQLAAANPSLSGYRIYLGSSGNAIVGVDSDGKDAISDGILLTSNAGSGLCPFICDVSSPLNTN